MTQAQKAQEFKALHKAGDPVVLYNIWDAGGAKALAKAGAKAAATGSWSVAGAQGYKDGEQLPLAFLEQIAARITASVDIPVSVDFEGCYAVEPEGVQANVARIIDAGAVGINFEDRVVQGTGLHSIEAQAARISAARAAGGAAGVPLFINARTDLFLGSDSGEHSGLIGAALERAAAYAEAGADGFFVPGLGDLALIRQVVDGVALPVNVMMGAQPTVAGLAEQGVARVSFGPAPYHKALTDLTERFKAIA